MSFLDFRKALSLLGFKASAEATESGAAVLETLAPELLIQIAENLDLETVANLYNTSSRLRIVVKTNANRICNAIVKIRLAALPGGGGNRLFAISEVRTAQLPFVSPFVLCTAGLNI